MENKIKFGRVVLVGRPNVGKSTLLNAMMQQKVAITSPLPQTTRKVSRVVYEDYRGKIIFSDTPGILNKVEDLMGKKVNLEAPKETGLADVVVMIVDISRPKNEEENKVLGIVRKIAAKKILVFNKIDKAFGPKDHLADYQYLEDEFDTTISTSALKEKYVKGLIKQIMEYLPEVNASEANSETDMISPEGQPKISMNSKEYVEELIREKAYLFLREEVPYSIKVSVNEIKEKKDMIVISADIVTTADRYKKMIIGASGRKIKEIGYNARKELELMSGKKIFLELTVKTNKNWMEETTATL